MSERWNEAVKAEWIICSILGHKAQQISLFLFKDVDAVTSRSPDLFLPSPSCLHNIKS